MRPGVSKVLRELWGSDSGWIKGGWVSGFLGASRFCQAGQGEEDVRMIRKHSYGVFLLVQIAFMLTSPIMLDAGVVGRLVELVVGLSLISVGLIVVRGNSKNLFFFYVVIGVLFVLWVAGILHPELRSLSVIRISLFIAFFLRVIYILGHHVFVSPRVSTSNRLYGAISIYLMLSALFAYLFQLMNILKPGSFICHSTLCPDGVDIAFTYGIHFYYSLSTLTTVGYGDITPVNPLAAMVSAMEALFGQLYVATVVARLVGLHLLEATRRR